MFRFAQHDRKADSILVFLAKIAKEINKYVRCFAGAHEF
ncbi:MAG: hypothetical protein IGBAC_1069 [Ignavibacteriae bacterium]|nr:MAG: hypothetical protein IGBAC_1543 [Ignavibacteriota bacterium]RCK75794.1 MAG: hypothetical protein IGBAC_1069 [Ignavibacteriota bacterium]